RLGPSPPCGDVAAQRRVGSRSEQAAFTRRLPLADHPQVPSPETDRARYLRNNMTRTERRVWSRLRSRQVGGYKFRRQVPLGPYFVDFLCISDRLAVEVDGPLHAEESDQRKTAWLEAAGYRVIRIPVTEVDESLDDVIHGIY